MTHPYPETRLDFPAFFERYRPISNPFDLEGLYEGRLFHRYLEDSSETRFLSDLEPGKLWTLCLGEAGLTIRAGHAFTDREGFFVASIARSIPLDDVLIFADEGVFEE